MANSPQLKGCLGRFTIQAANWFKATQSLTYSGPGSLLPAQMSYRDQLNRFKALTALVGIDQVHAKRQRPAFAGKAAVHAQVRAAAFRQQLHGAAIGVLVARRRADVRDVHHECVGHHRLVDIISAVSSLADSQRPPDMPPDWRYVMPSLEMA